MIRYEIDENNIVRAWNDELEQTEPFLYQPTNPDGKPFESREEAEAWASKWLYDFEHPEETDWYKQIVELKEIARQKVIAGEQINEDEALALAAQL